jgi:predicted cupin superfamily sugar epimerase
MSGTAADIGGIVRALGLVPHPEGGFFRETFRDPGVVTGNRPGTKRNASTSILFLVPAGGRSRLHRLASEETWIFLLGGPLAIIELEHCAPPRRTVIGKGSAQVHAVRADTWFGAVTEPGSPFTLVACTVKPGFDFADFELGERETLQKEYPQAREILEILA